MEVVITLSQKEITRYSIIKDLLDRKLKCKEAAAIAILKDVKETILNLYSTTYKDLNPDMFF